MRQMFSFVLLILLVATLTHAKSKEEKRLEKCAVVMGEILNVPDNIPKELLDKAECIAVMPSVKKVAFGFGGRFGAGVFICRKGKNFKGAWGAPAMYRLEGASIGFQLGGSARFCGRLNGESAWKTAVPVGRSLPIGRAVPPRNSNPWL